MRNKYHDVNLKFWCCLEREVSWPMIFVTYHRISADFVPGLTPHSSVATSGEMTVTSGMPRSNFGGSPTEIISVSSLTYCFEHNKDCVKKCHTDGYHLGCTVRSCRVERNTDYVDFNNHNNVTMDIMV